MTEQELDKLIQKFIDNRATPEEITFLEKREKETESKILADIFKDKEEVKRIRESIYDRIDKKIGEKTAYPWWKYASAAAVFMGIMITGYFYLQNQTASEAVFSPENTITLELEDGTVKVIEENGTVTLADKNGEVLGQQKGNQLVYNTASSVENLVYNTLSVPYGKTFEIQLSDGTHAHLNAGSSLKYPVKFLNGLDRQVYITGEAYLDVAKDSAHPFIVNADKLNIRVLGTQFNISAYPEDNVKEVVLVEGLVELHVSKSLTKQQNALLQPGFKASYNENDAKITKEAVLTNLYTSWRNGELVFRDMIFDNILKKLERHYNISIVNKNKLLSKEKFNASFGEKPSIEDVLKELRSIYNINYTIKDNIIIIR